MKHILILFMVISLSACLSERPSIPNGVIPPEEMIAILTDLHLVEGNAQVARSYTFAGQDFLDSSYRLVYAMHQIEVQTFDSSFRFYLKHPKYFETMYEQVIDNINRFEETQR